MYASRDMAISLFDRTFGTPYQEPQHTRGTYHITQPHITIQMAYRRGLKDSVLQYHTKVIILEGG